MYYASRMYLAARSLAVAASLATFALAGCNSLTEPNQFNVAKEKPRSVAAAPKPQLPAENNQGAANLNAAPAPKPQAPAAINPTVLDVKDGKATIPQRRPAPAAPPPAPAGGSCGE